MDYTYDYTTGNLKIDFQTDMEKVTTTNTRPVENCSNRCV